MTREFEIDAYRNGPELLILLRGRLVLRHCQDAKVRLSGLFNPEVDQVYIYLGELTFLDSAGLGVLVGTKMTSNKHRTRLVLLSPVKRVEDIFRVSKLDSIFEIRVDKEAESIRQRLEKEEFVLWRDQRDDRQALYPTQSDLTEIREEPLPGLRGLAGHGSDQRSDQQERVRQLCTDAVEYIRQGDYDKAIAQYLQALSLDPTNLSALNNLGIVYEKRPEWYPRALETWKRVLDISQQRDDDKHAQRAAKHLESLSKLVASH